MQNIQGTDTLLVEALKQGSELAFSELFNNYNKWLYGEALFACRNPDDAKDVVQEVFIGLWEKRATIDAGKDIRNYLYIAMRNTCISKAKKIRSAKNYMAYQLRQPEEYMADPYVTLEDDKAELIQQVRKAVQQIRGKASREAIQTIYLEEESYKSVSLKTGFPVQTLRNAVARGIKFLREKINVQY
jgi:RNA polymerase sigma-70 factor (ECF subfamily)